MHDAPLISPENKDSGAEIFAGLPKVTLFAPLPTDASTPDELRAATHAVVQALADDHVVYAELRLRPAPSPSTRPTPSPPRRKDWTFLESMPGSSLRVMPTRPRWAWR